MIEAVEDREFPIEFRAVQSLGLGFDLTNDFRLKFAKGYSGERLVVVDEVNTRDIVIPGGKTIKSVSNDIRCDKGDTVRFKSDVLEFNRMSELLNQKSSIQGKVPSGYFNSIFDLSGAWLHDATDTKYLAFDGYFISLYYLHLTASPLVLQEKVKKAVPSNWDPASLARFIHTYGTHIIVGMGIGGQDVVCVRQKASSWVSSVDLKGYLEDLGDHLFSDGRSSSPLRKIRDVKQQVPEVFYRILQSNTMQLTSISESSSKDGLTIICSKRGGIAHLQSHHNWLQSVPANPDVILFKFVPITSLLIGIPGSGYLSHAINLYLRYKPKPDDLRYFLEFQVPLQWAPMFSALPLGPQRRNFSSPSLQFYIMGPKLRVSSSQVSSDRKPVTGLRLYLEGEKCNRLALHLQHLSSVPNILESLWAASTTSRPCQWRGSDNYEMNSQYLEPVKWKRYSNICTVAVKHDPKWLQGERDGVFVVTGGQLVTKGKWPKMVLHLRLLFTYLPNCTIRKTEWATIPAVSHKSSFLASFSTTFLQREVAGPPKQVPAALNSGVYPDGPPLPANARKLLQYIETAEVVRGPHDIPGHWLVTAARLVMEGGKIALQTKFALLNYPL
ncbi:MACPF domain-containing protein At1g14780-like [Macadamia integrifolia]|uniref:MACPF domain-containing protein At1g14780-like n=1 Tax=Macadamia integrifolia TaxID=60698 RepID=UPI001C4EB418|nr:MACPF domain-containing protein At1g14780-like [Macadamia integrifolia]